MEDGFPILILIEMKYLDYIYFLLSRNVTKNTPMLHKNGNFLAFMCVTTSSIAFAVTQRVWVFLACFAAVAVFVELVWDEGDYKRLRKIEAKYKDLPPDVVRRRAIIAQITLPILSIGIAMLVGYFTYLKNR